MRESLNIMSHVWIFWRLEVIQMIKVLL
jgi:hypothetical protein